MAGTWRPWALASGSQFRPGPAPACDSPQMATELAELKNFPRMIPAAGTSFSLIRSGLFWQGVGTVKPWNDLTTQKISEYRLDRNRTDTVAGLAQADAVAGLIIERAKNDGSQ